MLSRLLIKNYALIDSLSIEFDKHLNIITGETGAGKSIIMGALGLILGNRADSKHFFDSQRKCVIEGEFLVESYQLQDLFKQLDLDYEQVSIIRRELTPDGKSRAFVNDTPVTLQSLRILGERLIDVHSQHATLQINQESFQLFVLDTVSQSTATLKKYTTAYRQYNLAKKELAQLEAAFQQAKLENDYHQFIFDELSKSTLVPGEQEELEAEQGQLEHAEEIKRHLHHAGHLFQGGEDNVIDGLKRIVAEVQQTAKYLPSIEPILERVESSLIELKDIALEVEQTGEGVFMNEERLLEIQERLSLIYTLQTKHRVGSVEELIKLRDELSEKLYDSSSLGQRVEGRKKEISVLYKDVFDLAIDLRERRSAVIEAVETGVEKILGQIGMPHARLQVVMEATSELREQGLDEISFWFTANKGQELKPIQKVASGGELSRVMLAIKSIVARKSALPTIVFDEIDTGISGEIALRVGELMDTLSTNLQVISITHLPQIASKGKAHYKVYKIERNDRAQSNITRLKEEERVIEVAEMLSGANPAETAIEHARRMLDRA